MGKGKIAAGAAAVLLPFSLIAVLIGGGAVAASASTGGAQKLAKVGIEEYLSGDGGATEGEKYWKWTVGSAFQNGHDTPWCASFTSWCGNEAGLYEDGYTPKDAACAGWVDYYGDHPDMGEVHGPDDESYSPQVGDVVVYGEDTHHIGIVAGTGAGDTDYVEAAMAGAGSGKTAQKRKAHLQDMLNEVVADDDVYLTVEGNTSDSDATSSNGNSLGVHAKERSKMTYVIHLLAPSFNTYGSGDFDRYRLTEDELSQIASLCVAEQGSAKGAAAEASLIANRYELHGGKYKSLCSYVRNSGWFAHAAEHMDRRSASKAAKEAVRAVLCDGKRTLPKFVDEHDWLGDISSISTGSVYRRSDYAKGVTKVKNIYDSTWTFWCFPTPSSDPFGYTSAANREKYGDDCYTYSD